MTDSPADTEATTSVDFEEVMRGKGAKPGGKPRRARSLTRRVAKFIGIFILVVLVTFAVFFVWASGGDSDDREVAPGLILELPASGAPRAATTELKVVTFNIGYGRGPAGDESGPWTREHIVKHLDGIAGQLVALDADLAFLQEVDLASSRSHDIDQGRYLAEKASYPFASCVTTWEKNYVPFPYWPPSRHYGAMKSGQCLLSRFPITASTRHRLPQPASNPWWRNAFYLHRALDHAKIKVGDTTFDVINVHLEAFDADNRMDHAQRLANLIGQGGQGGIDKRRLIVAGDFNAPPPEATHRKGFVDEPEADFTGDATIALVRNVDGLTQTLIDESVFTFPADLPSRRLDYLFIGAGLSVLETRVVTAPGPWSDHLPVFARLAILP
jgi:endonuclease/exonuclease/phosphatase family metal-dependent hydrolase